mgnify:CR=1 FL=1
MKINITKKQASAVCSKDEFKPALKGLLYEPKKSRLTVTNGHVLLSYNVTPDENDSTGILPSELFKSKISDNCTYEINGSAKRVDQHGSAEYNLIDERYPDYESVIPASIKNKHEVCLDLNLLKQLFDAVPKNDNNTKTIKLTFNTGDSNSVIKFKQFNVDSDEYNYEGVLMPVRLGS